MTEYNMYEAKTNLSKICRLLEEKKEDMIIISRNGKPVLKVTLFEQSPRSSLFGAGKGLFTIPEDFDDIDIANDFEETIFPR